MDPIIISTSTGKYFVQPESIIRVQSIDNYSKIYIINAQPIVVSKVLLWLEERLPKGMFTRVHRSHLVNRNYVKSIKGNWSSSNVTLTNGEKIGVSRRKRAGLIKSNEWIIGSS